MSVSGSFSKGFLIFYNEQIFCDLTLTLDGKQYNAHQLVFVHSSEYFARLIHKKNPQGSPVIFELDKLNRSNMVLTTELFEKILKISDAFQYMYTDEVQLDMDTITPLKAAASILEVKKLESLINKFLYSNLTKDHIPKVLTQALAVNSTQVVDHCLYIISKHFSYFFSNRASLFEIITLPPKVMLQLLSHEMLFTTSEDTLFDCLSEYLTRNTVPSKLTKSLWETIDFYKLSSQKRSQAKKIHAAREIMRAERSTKSRIYGRVIDIQQDKKRENQGIIYHIATNDNTHKWQNPHLTGKVVGSLSSVEKGKVENIFDFSMVMECWTNDIPASYLTIDFGEKVSLLPTHYTIRHGSSSRQDCLRIWLLLASNDNSNWKVLSRHKDDKFLNLAFAVHTWKLPTHNFLEPELSEGSGEGEGEGSVVQPSDKFGWRYFRICQTGHNVSMTNFLSISGVEFYGECFIYDKSIIVPIDKESS